MSYCLNPSCPKPVNHPKARKCRACGSKLLLRDRYHLVKGLGKGGFGATFLAADLSLPGKPLCVIKQLRPNTDNPNFLNMARELFEREAKTLGIVGNHPQIPRLLDYFEDRQQFYLIQEFVKGNNLQQEIKKNGVLNENQVRQVLKEVLEILRAIHAQKVIHRDIKPANIIRREIDNRLVLIDFGVVKNQVNTVAAGGDPTALTAFAVGTPGFAPPEQLAMRPVYASDVYALGVTCMYLMTGKAPKNLDCDPITGEIDWFKNLNVSDNFAEILTNMLEVSVKNRYKTAEEVLQALDIENHIDSLSESIISSAKLEENPRTSMFTRNTVASRRNSLSNTRSSTTTRRIGGSRFNRNPITSKSSNSQKTHLAARDRANKTQFKPVKIDAESMIDFYTKGRRDFGFKDISKQDLQKAELSESKFHNLLAIRTNFQGADLSTCNFSDSDLRQAILRSAKLNRTLFKKVNLEGADLRGADLREVSFDRCKLGGVNLSGANLTNAKISKEELNAAKTNWLTVMPNGRRGFW